jgi:arginase
MPTKPPRRPAIARIDRRTLLAAALTVPWASQLGCAPPRSPTPRSPASRRPARPLAPQLPASRGREIDLIAAPNNLGLRPPAAGVEPGTWRAPEALERAGLSARLRPARHVQLVRPRYLAGAAAGTAIRNGDRLRTFSLALATEVERSLTRGALPVVIGGDCSTMLGCLLGLRRSGGRGLVHVDGHSDFAQLAVGDARLGSAAGMDLALATGRGDAMLTRWPGVAGALVDDADAVQVGERDDIDGPGGYPGLSQTAITRISVQAVHAAGIPRTVARVLDRLGDRTLDRAWLHIDLDVLDQRVLRAVDSPGSPGLTYSELTELVRALLRSRRIAGLDVAIFDPDLDPDGSHARNIVACVGAILDEDAGQTTAP